MREIGLREAKSHLSQLVDEVAAGEAAVITRHGRKEAVVIGWAEYERLRNVPSLGWLLTHSPLSEDDLPRRRLARALSGGST